MSNKIKTPAINYLYVHLSFYFEMACITQRLSTSKSMNLKKIVGRFPSPFLSSTWKYWKSWLEFQRWKKQLTNYMPIGQTSSRGIGGRTGTGKKGVWLTCFTSRDKKEAKDEATRWSSRSFTGSIKVQWWYWIWFVTTIPFIRIRFVIRDWLLSAAKSCFSFQVYTRHEQPIYSLTVHQLKLDHQIILIWYGWISWVIYLIKLIMDFEEPETCVFMVLSSVRICHQSGNNLQPSFKWFASWIITGCTTPGLAEMKLGR